MVTIGLLTFKRNEDIISTVNQFSMSKKRDIELIIVDNNESSQEVEVTSNIVLPESWRLVYCFDGKNKGVGGGRNVIFSLASHENIIFLDDDVVIDDVDVIVDNVNAEFNSDHEIGCLAFKIIDNKSKLINNYEFPHKNKKLKDRSEFFTYYYVGAGHAILKSSYMKIGGYSSGMGLYGMEEVDFSYRLINAGYSIKYVSKIFIYHKKSPSGRVSNYLSIFNSFNNKVLIAAKYLKFRYFISHYFAWSLEFLRATGDIKTVFGVFFNGIAVRKKSVVRFRENFYDYCKKVNAWLWW